MEGLPAATEADAHEILPQPGTAYSTSGVNTGLPAELTNPVHYPIEALCQCNQVIRCERWFQAPWTHTGRRPGDPR